MSDARDAFDQWLAAFEHLSFEQAEFHLHLAAGLKQSCRIGHEQASMDTAHCSTASGTRELAGEPLLVVQLVYRDPLGRGANEQDGDQDSDAA